MALTRWSKIRREPGAQRCEFVSSLRQVWFSALCATVVIFAIAGAVPHPPRTPAGHGQCNDVRALSVLGFGFTGAALLIHRGALSLAFMPYTKGWMLDDWAARTQELPPVCAAA
jgi:hypothetical protein